MHITASLLVTGAGINVIRSGMVSQEWAIRMKRSKYPSLRIVTKQPLTLDCLIVLHLCTGDLQIRMWIGVASHIAVNKLVGTFFFHRFMREIFPSYRKIVHWHSHSVAILVCRRSSTAAATSLMSSASSKDTVHTVFREKFAKAPIRVARQVVAPGTPQQKRI